MSLEPGIYDYGDLEEIRNYSRGVLKVRWTIQTQLKTKKIDNHRMAHVESKPLKPKHHKRISKLITGQFDSKTLTFRLIAVSTTHPFLKDTPFNFRIILCKMINNNGISESKPCYVKVPFFIRVKVLNDKKELFCQTIQPTNRHEYAEISFELPEQTCKDLRLFYSYRTKFIEITLFEKDPKFQMDLNHLVQSSQGASNNSDEGENSTEEISWIENGTLDLDEIPDYSDQDYVEDNYDQDDSDVDNMEAYSNLDNTEPYCSDQLLMEDSSDLDHSNRDKVEDNSDLDNTEDNSNQEKVEDNFDEVSGNSGQDEEENCDPKFPESSRNGERSKNCKHKKSTSEMSYEFGNFQKKDRPTREEKTSGNRQDKASVSQKSEATLNRRDKTPSNCQDKASTSRQDKPLGKRPDKSGAPSESHQCKPSGSGQKVSSNHLDIASGSDSLGKQKDKSNKDKKSNDSEAESAKSDTTVIYGDDEILNSEPDGPQCKKIKLEKSDSKEDLIEDQDPDTIACPDCHYITTKLLKNPIFTDVIIQADLVKIPCHRAILSTVSSVFENLLRDTDFNAVVEVTDHVSATTAGHLITYIYDGVVPELDFDSYIKLYEAANFFEIKTLMVKCLEECQLKLVIENAIAAFEFAISSGCLSLKTKALDLIVENKVAVLSSDGWVSMRADVSKELSASLLTHKC